MLFEELPLDGLGLIIALIGPYEVGKLWLTGSPRMRWALSTGRGLLKFDFKLDTHFPLGFPSLVGHLTSLEHLTVDFVLPQFIVKLFVPKMPPLPRNLRYLELKQKRAIIEINALIKVDPTQFSNLHTLILSQHNVKVFKTMDMRRLSALKILKLIGPATHHPPVLNVHLPPNLEELLIYLSDINPKWMASLPISLTKLHLYVRTLTPFFDLLPPQLLDFTIHHGFSSVGLRNWQALPRGLTHFSTSSVGSLVSPDMVAQLPPTLVSLSLDMFKSVDWDVVPLWKAMPPTITKMGGSCFWPRTLSKSLVEALPRSLCQDITAKVDLEAVSALPKGIVSLHIPTSENLIPVVYPPHLQSLFLPIECMTEMSILPLSLTILHLQGTCETLTKEMAQIFPKFLRQLSLTTSNQNQSGLAWLELPRTLTYLRLSSLKFDLAEKKPQLSKKEAQNLPPLLRDFWLHYAVVSPDFYEELPRTLTTLNLIVQDLPMTSYEAISELPVLSDLSITSTLSPASWRTIFSKMPRDIRSFGWRAEKPNPGNWETDLQNEDFLLLPRCILKLNLPHSPKVTREVHLFLPRYLEIVRFSSTSYAAIKPYGCK